MAELRLVNVYKRWGANVGVHDFDLRVADREFLVLLGPSGCGKSTTMRMIAGLDELSDGEIWLGDRRVDGLDPKDRDVSMVFQSYGLYPNLSVYENIRFPLRVRKVAKGGSSRAGHDRGPARRARGLRRPSPGRALRRSAPAGRARAGDRARADGVPHGRAAVEPRREAQGVHARPRSSTSSTPSRPPPSTSPTTRSRR